MTITRRGEKRFAGIVAVGENRTAACDAFRAAVQNKEMNLLSESSSVFVAVAGVDAENAYSPISGEQATVAEDSLVESLESTASDSKDVDVFISVCTDGCKSVLVSDIKYQPDFCPSCSSALPELDAHETIDALSELESESSDDNYSGEDMNVTGKQGIVVVGDTFEEAQSFFVEASSDSENRTFLTDGSASFVTHSGCGADKFSPFSGQASESTEDEFELESTSSDGEEQVEYLQCLAGDCGAHVLASSENASFCPRCSSGLVDPEVLAALSGDDTEELDTDEDEDDLDLDVSGDEDEEDFESDSNEDEDEEDFESDSGDELDDLDEDLDDLDDEDFESDSSDDEDEDDLDDLDDLDEDDLDDLEDDLDDLDDDEDMEDIDIDDDEEDFESDSAVAAEVEINFFEAYAGDKESHDVNMLSLAHCGNINGEATWVAFYGGYPVARCLRSQASNQEIFDSAKFGEAAKLASKSNGIQEALTDMGFEMLKPDVDLNASVSSKMVEQHQTELQEVRNQTEQEVSEVKDRFGAALSTCAMALHRNLIKGYNNPVAETLIASISAAGISNAEELVNSAFEQQSDNFTKNLVTLAGEQVNKPLQSQNDFAEMVSQAGFLKSTSSAGGVEIGRSLSSQSSDEDEKQLSSESSSDNNDTDFGAKAASALASL